MTQTEILLVSLCAFPLFHPGSAEASQVQREVPEQTPERPARGSRQTSPVSTGKSTFSSCAGLWLLVLVLLQFLYLKSCP